MRTRFERARRGLIALALLSVAVGPVRAEEVRKSAVRIDSSTFDFGKVVQGSKVTHDFVVKNTGNADLKIEQVIPTCGCTAANAADPTIKPGAETTIHVEFDTTAFTGEKIKTVR